MSSKALVATDLSAASVAVVNCLQGLKFLGTKECILCYCFDIPAVKAFPEHMRQWFEEQLAEQKAILEGHGFKVSVRAVPGLPQTEISRMAAKENCSLLVVGSHGHGLGSEIFLGGIASAVIHHTSVPALILRLKKAADGQPSCASGHCDFLDHILYPTDFSDHAEQAFTFVENLAAAGARKITLLHVQDRAKLEPHLSDRLDEFNQIDKNRLDRLRVRLETIGATSVEIELCSGIPKAEVLDRAKQKKVGLVVMGSHGRGFIQEFFLGSVSHTVARHAEAPVLLVPLMKHE